VTASTSTPNGCQDGLGSDRVGLLAGVLEHPADRASAISVSQEEPRLRASDGNVWLESGQQDSEEDLTGRLSEPASGSTHEPRQTPV
jgi:hypothetical protein